MVENITSLILKSIKNKELLNNNNIYVNSIHTGTFYQLLNEIKPGLESKLLKECPDLKESLKGQIARAAKVTGLPETLITAVGQVESGLRHVNPQTGQVVKSPAGALGLMQLMPATAKELGVNVYEQAENILGGAKYLVLAWQKFHGKLELVLAGYNAGINRVQKAIQAADSASWEVIKRQLPQETQNYVAKVMSLLNNLENPEPSPLNNRITPVNPLEIKPGWESKLLKFSQSQLREIFSPQNFLFDRQSIETVKTKEGDLNLLTGEENFIFTFLKGVNSDLWSINRPVSLPKLPLIIFSVLQEIPFKAEKTIIILHLTPENLGSLVIKVTKQEDKLTILFCTTNHNVKEIIEASFPQLKEALFQQNLLLDKAMVLITNQEEGRGQNNYSEGRWQTGQPYTSQKVKTKEVSLSLLTGEENFMPKATTINYWV
jgi:hypothetical protein